MAQQAALETTTSNIANVNTEGYVRRRPVLNEQDPVTYGSSSRFGTGVEFAGVSSLRNRVLELQIVGTTGEYSAETAFADAIRPIENFFANPDAGIAGALNEFFNSLTALTATPQEFPARQRVLTAAEDLGASFRETSVGVGEAQQQIDVSIRAAVAEVNELSRQVADLNGEVSKREMSGQDTGSYEDRQTELLKQLSSLIGISVARADDGITVTTANGTPLAVGRQSFSLVTASDPVTGMLHVHDDFGDVTPSLTGGKIGGLLRARDNALPGLQTELDELAASLASAVNNAHRQGTDLNGVPGENIFLLPPNGTRGVAASLKIAIRNPSQFAASSDGEPGGSGNVEKLLSVGTSELISGQSPIDALSSLVFRVGNLVAHAEAKSEAANVSLGLLVDQRGAVSGVSLDEEAANLIRFQGAYHAAAM
jgi:flagellar hook-associated protein 1 FlgK